MLPDAITTTPSPRTGACVRESHVVFGPGEPGGTLTVSLAFAELFARVGLTTASAFLDMPGEVVSGHPDRHVARIEVPGGAHPFYLKRQHVVGWREKWRNRRAGFGWVSRCEREADILQQLQTAGLPAPRVAAFGAHERRAFLLLEEVPDVVELRRLLGDTALSLADRRRLAENIGRAVGAIHAAGITTPDLTAKHVLVHRESLAVTFLDWQSSVRTVMGAAARADALGALHASLTAAFAPRADRARVLRAYLSLTSPPEGEVAPRSGAGGGERSKSEEARANGVEKRSGVRDSPPPPPAGAEAGSGDLPLKEGGQRHARAARSDFVQIILRAAERHADRRSVRDQLQPFTATNPQRLVWLAGEAVCAVPKVAAVWPQPAIAPPFYGVGPEGPAYIRIAGREAVLVRGYTSAPLGRFRAWLRTTPWRSPGVTAGRVLFHLERYGVPAPKLLAFGQRLAGTTGAEWFALYEVPRGVLLRRWRRTACATERRRIFIALGECLRTLHDAGCMVNDVRAAFAVSADGRVSVADPFAVRIVRRVTESARQRDLRAAARLLRVE